MSTPMINQANAVIRALEEGKAQAIIEMAQWLIKMQKDQTSQALVRQYRHLCYSLGYSEEFSSYWENFYKVGELCTPENT